MGNCLGRSKSGNFSGEGRTLNDPASSNRPKVPAQSGGQRLGSGPSASVGQNDSGAQSAAARAAEERLKASVGKGKLGKQLDAQKSRTQGDTLAQVSAENRAARDMDAGAETRAYN